VLAVFIGLSLPLPSTEAVIKALFDFLAQNFNAIYNKISMIVVDPSPLHHRIPSRIIKRIE
jgi:hypothetical protein